MGEFPNKLNQITTQCIINYIQKFINQILTFRQQIFQKILHIRANNNQKHSMKGMQKINADFYVDKTKKLGQGNFGVVYKGYMLSENKIVAVKYMTKEQLNKNPDYEREITVMEDLSKINHPNIMGYYGYEMAKDGLYCFIEFCGGGTLKMLAKKKVSEVKTMTLVKQLFQAMSYINDLNKVHRDLKPDNILLDENLDLKIADFGLARDIEITMTKGACTPLFAAPQVFNLQHYDQKCDVWSAGLILYEMLTGRQMFADIKTKNQLNEELSKFKGGNRKITYPKQFHKNWTLLTEKMLNYDNKKRPSFKELLKYFEDIKDQMQTDLNAKYGFDQSNQGDIRASKMRSLQINPYASRQKNDKTDPQLKLVEQKSYNKYTNAQKYLIFFRMKTDFMCKIIKAFTSNPYAILKNVYKYILMFLSVSCYISKLSENLVELKGKQIMTPDGLIETKDIAPAHLKQWEELISEFKTKHAINIERFRQVLENQIVEKITKSYLNRDEQKKIIGSYKNLLSWIDETTKGNFMKHKHYAEMFVQIMNEEATHCSEPQLKSMQTSDIKTYAYIRLTGYLDDFLPEKEYKNEDFIRLRRQQLQNMGKSQLIDYIKKFNNK